MSDVKEVRAAALRVLRYLINDEATKKTFMNLNLDFLVTRYQEHDVNQTFSKFYLGSDSVNTLYFSEFCFGHLV